MDKPEVIFVQTEEYEGLYINGEIAAEEHPNLSIDTVLSALEGAGLITYRSVELTDKMDEELQGRGELPKRFEDLGFKLVRGVYR